MMHHNEEQHYDYQQKASLQESSKYSLVHTGVLALQIPLLHLILDLPMMT